MTETNSIFASPNKLKKWVRLLLSNWLSDTVQSEPVVPPSAQSLPLIEDADAPAGRGNLKSIAIFIDAENISSSAAVSAFQIAQKYGPRARTRAFAYADWSKPMAGWRAVLSTHAIIPVQQFAINKHKNSSDIALVCGAMQLIFSDQTTDTIIIVSSDSDFAPLAVRVRAMGLTVIGVAAQRNAPPELIAAYSHFHFVGPDKVEPIVPTEVPDFETTLLSCFPADGSWIEFSAVGDAIRRAFPNFQTSAYATRKLSRVVASMDVETRRVPGSTRLFGRRRQSPNLPPSTLQREVELDVFARLGITLGVSS